LVITAVRGDGKAASTGGSAPAPSPAPAPPPHSPRARSQGSGQSSSGGGGGSSGGASSLPAPSPAGKSPAFSSVNGVPLELGRTMHLGVCDRDVAPRVLSVGDVGRAERLSALLSGRRTVTSSRGFVTHTGTFEGVPITVCATLMGFANMDFVVRELHAVVRGPMAVLRLGTCGGLQAHCPEGTLVLVKAALRVTRNPDAAAQPAPYSQLTAMHLHQDLTVKALEGSNPGAHSLLSATPAFPYDISGKVAPHAALTALYGEALRRGGNSVVEGLGASADSFYSSQGRASGAWGDRNNAVIPTLEKAGVSALEMETCACICFSCSNFTPPSSNTRACSLFFFFFTNQRTPIRANPFVHLLCSTVQFTSWTWRGPPAHLMRSACTLLRPPLCSFTGPRARRWTRIACPE
jgi:uridine phosphorylase